MAQTITRIIKVNGIDIAINTTKDLKDATKLLNEEIGKVKIGTKKYNELNNSLAVVKATQKANRDETKRLQTQLVASGKAGLGAYRKLSSQLIIMRTQYKDLAAGGKANTREAKNLLREVNKLDTRLKSIDKSAGQFGRNVGNYSSAFQGLGRTLLTLTGIGGGLFVFQNLLRSAGRIVLDFDRQLIAVSKTTDIVDDELDDFSDKVKRLGRELKGISIQGLLESSEIAGQLGIRGTDNILKFAETIEKLKLTSDIVGQESARQFAKFIEVSTDSVENADRLGSVITRLGNNFATTEKQILNNTTEIQKGVAVYNTSAQGVLALGAATEALGSKAEQSRSAIQLAFNVIDKAIATGEGLEDILRLTALTEEQLAKQFQKDATGVFVRFIKGLAKAKDEGQNLRVILNKLGLHEKRAFTVIGALAANYEILGEAIEQANQEYGDSIALTTEAERAADATTSKVEDFADSWSAFILSFDDGNGPLARAFKGVLGFFKEQLDLVTLFNEEGADAVFAAQLFGGPTKLAEAIKKAKENIDQAVKDYEDHFFKPFAEVIKKTEDIEANSTVFEAFKNGLIQIGLTSEEADTRISSLKKTIEEKIKATEEDAKATEEAVISINTLKERQKELRDVMNAAAIGSKEFKDAESELKKVTDELNIALGKVKDFVEDGSLKDYQDQLREVIKQLKNQNLEQEELNKLLKEQAELEKTIFEEKEKRRRAKENALLPSGTFDQKTGKFRSVQQVDKKPLPTSLTSSNGLTPQQNAELEGQKKLNDLLKEFDQQARDETRERIKDDLEKQKELFEKAASDVEDILGRFFKNTTGINVDFSGLITALQEGGEILGEVAKKIGFDIANGIANNAFNAELEKVEENKQFALDALQEEFGARLQAAEGNAAIEAQIQEELAVKRAKINKEAAKKEQKIKIKQAIANGFLAITQSLANTKLPFPALLIAPAIIAATTAIQVAALKKVKFRHGGTIDKEGIIQGPSHEQGGVEMQVNGRHIEAEGGEMIRKYRDGMVQIFSRPDTAEIMRKRNRETEQRIANFQRIFAERDNAVHRNLLRAREGLKVTGTASIDNAAIERAVQNGMRAMIPEIANAVRAGAGSGTREGIRESSIRQRREEKLERQRTL